MTTDSHDPVGRFFDSLTGEYTEAIERCFPRYREMLGAVLDYLPPNRTFRSVLELGCGTGNLTVLLREAFPEAALHVVDISGDSLEVCRSRFDSTCDLTCDRQDFRHLDYARGSFDLVVSSIAIHHLQADGKRELFGRVQDWLTDDGVFALADQCAGETPDLTARHVAGWKALSMQAGSSEAEWAMWMQHQAECDHHDTLSNQMTWLREADFPIVDCCWRSLLWSVIQARKSVATINTPSMPTADAVGKSVP